MRLGAVDRKSLGVTDLIKNMILMKYLISLFLVSIFLAFGCLSEIDEGGTAGHIRGVVSEEGSLDLIEGCIIKFDIALLDLDTIMLTTVPH